MGNRAIITNTDKTLAVYLHWNGGMDSVRGFVEYCRLKEYRSDDYGWARLCQVIGNFFGGTTSVGILPYTTDESMCSYGSDNGVYVVDMHKWEIVDRVYPWSGFEEQESYLLEEMLEDIDSCMPSHDKLGSDFLSAVELPSQDVCVGDTVFIHGARHLVVHKLTADEVGFRDLCFEHNIKPPAWAFEAAKHEVGTPVLDWMLNAGCSFMENCNSYVDTRVRTKRGKGSIPLRIADARDKHLAEYKADMDKIVQHS